MARLLAMRGGLGITRIGDITGLDVLGVPVVQVVRPHSLSNSVSQGKGHTLVDAAISAILESAESFCAERLEQFHPIVTTANALNVSTLQFERHLWDGELADWRDVETDWIAAENLLDGRMAMVPLELVHTAYVFPPSPRDGLFIPTTTGLAAAFSEEDAVVHGILECVERDAVARAHGTHGFLQKQRVDPESLGSEALCKLVETLRASGFLAGFWHAPSSTGIPVIWCHLMEDGEVSTAILPYPAEGSAAGINPAAAAFHAYHEAAQSRLAAISGARDDLTRRAYPRYPDWQKIIRHRRLLAEKVEHREIDSADWEHGDSRDLLPRLLDALATCGIQAIYKVSLDASGLDGLAAVKILVPEFYPLVEA